MSSIGHFIAPRLLPRMEKSMFVSRVHAPFFEQNWCYDYF
jgi:hypothetical protein